MALHSYIKLTGELTVQKFNSNNELIDQIHVPNLIVTTGKEHVAERMINDSEVKMSHMAIGSNTAVANVGNSALGTELGRVALTSSTRTGANVKYTAIFPAGTGTGSITESGIFNADTAGTMMCRTTFPVISKSNTETIAISWTVTVG